MKYIFDIKNGVSDQIVLKYKNQAVATVHEAMGRRGYVDSHIKALSPEMKICGRALTVECKTGDNLMLAKAIKMANKGEIIVMDAGSAHDAGAFGEVLATECITKRIGGFATSGSVRDSSRLKEIGFPVFSHGVSIQGTSKAALGSINKPISFGGVVVNPGDLILGDMDGIVVVPKEIAEEVLIVAENREKEEEIIMARIKAGESFYDIKNYSEVLKKLGCSEEEI